MTDRTKTARIAKENAETLARLTAGEAPEQIRSHYAHGWREAYASTPDMPMRPGQIARFEAGVKARKEAAAREKASKA